MAKSTIPLIWLDLEMTGLDPDSDRIIEIATIVTNSELEVLAEGPELAIRQDDKLLAGMDEWNTEHHTRSGLLDRVRNSEYTERQAEEATTRRNLGHARLLYNNAAMDVKVAEAMVEHFSLIQERKQLVGQVEALKKTVEEAEAMEDGQ